MLPIKITELLEELLTATTFEKVADVALRSVLAQAADVLGGLADTANARLLRAMLHLRPGGGYRGLAVMRNGDDRCASLPDDDSMLPSVTVWEWVESTSRILCVDVIGQTVSRADNEPINEDIDVICWSSRPRLLYRDATNLIAIPLRHDSAHVVGMISVEIFSQDGWEHVISATVAQDFQCLADLVTPYLLSRPMQASQERRFGGDSLLPVVGPTMGRLVQLLSVFSKQDETILISGPTGVGKSRLARWCHAQSSRREHPFECVNLHAIPRDMQLAELFGWRRGAFTGAVANHRGCVERARGGTLFLDEVDKLSMDAQSGLLDLLEMRSFRLLGDDFASRYADVRFIVGTNIDLLAAVRAGQFREDLYFRINVLPVELPPLSGRTDEIVEWAQYMLERRHKESGGLGSARLSFDAEHELLRFPWPGNLRQLDNVVRRAYALALASGHVSEKGVQLSAQHITQALGFERSGEAVSLVKILKQAAHSYAVEAQRRAVRGTPIGLDLAESFAGLVLSAGAALTASRGEAFRLYGLEHMVESRNHHKSFERAVTRVVAALKQLGEPADEELTAQLSGRHSR